jgi:hypothetical protein
MVNKSELVLSTDRTWDSVSIHRSTASFSTRLNLLPGAADWIVEFRALDFPIHLSASLILIITRLRKRLTGNSPLVIARSIIEALMPYIVLRPEMLVALTSAFFFKVSFSLSPIPSRAVRTSLEPIFEASGQID